MAVERLWRRQLGGGDAGGGDGGRVQAASGHSKLAVVVLASLWWLGGDGVHQKTVVSHIIKLPVGVVVLVSVDRFQDGEMIGRSAR